MKGTEVEVELPPGTGFDALGKAIADIIQHKTVYELHLKGRMLRARANLPEGMSLTQPYLADTDLKDVARAVSKVEEIVYRDLPFEILSTLARATALGLYPIGWLSSDHPLHSASCPPHPGLGEHYWLAGLPGYVSVDLDASSLLLFAGFERDNMRSATHVFRLLPAQQVSP